MLRRRAPRSPAVLAFLGLLGTLSGAALADPPAPPASPPSPAPAPSAAVPAPAAAPPAAAPPAPTTSDVAAPAVPPASPPAAAPPTAAPASAAPPAATLAAPAAPPRYDLAVVHLASDYPGAVLELRSYVDSGAWQVACPMPCDRALVTLGSEARVSAPGMSTSNVFRIDPGPGIALVKVNGGSRATRTFGILGLAVGIPLGLAGTAMYSYGSYSDDDGLAIAGGIVLGTGAVMMLAAIPLLLSGTTNVLDGKGRMVAASAPQTATE